MKNIKTGRIRLAVLLILITIFSYLLIFQPKGPKPKTTTQDKESAEEKKADKPNSQVVTGSIPNKGSLYLSLVEKEVPHELITIITRALNKVYDLRHSSPGDEYRLEYCPPDALIDFEYSYLLDTLAIGLLASGFFVLVMGFIQIIVRD